MTTALRAVAASASEDAMSWRHGWWHIGPSQGDGSHAKLRMMVYACAPRGCHSLTAGLTTPAADVKGLDLDTLDFGHEGDSGIHDLEGGGIAVRVGVGCDTRRTARAAVFDDPLANLVELGDCRWLRGARAGTSMDGKERDCWDLVRNTLAQLGPV